MKPFQHLLTQDIWPKWVEFLQWLLILLKSWPPQRSHSMNAGMFSAQESNMRGHITPSAPTPLRKIFYYCWKYLDVLPFTEDKNSYVN